MKKLLFLMIAVGFSPSLFADDFVFYSDLEPQPPLFRYCKDDFRDEITGREAREHGPVLLPIRTINVFFKLLSARARSKMAGPFPNNYEKPNIDVTSSLIGAGFRRFNQKNLKLEKLKGVKPVRFLSQSKLNIALTS